MSFIKEEPHRVIQMFNYNVNQADYIFDELYGNMYRNLGTSTGAASVAFIGYLGYWAKKSDENRLLDQWTDKRYKELGLDQLPVESRLSAYFQLRASGREQFPILNLEDNLKGVLEKGLALLKIGSNAV